MKQVLRYVLGVLVGIADATLLFLSDKWSDDKELGVVYKRGSDVLVYGDAKRGFPLVEKYEPRVQHCQFVKFLLTDDFKATNISRSSRQEWLNKKPGQTPDSAR